MQPAELLNLTITKKMLDDILLLLKKEYGIKVTEELIQTHINKENLPNVISADATHYQEIIKRITKTIANDFDIAMKDLAVTFGLAEIKKIITKQQTNTPEQKVILLILNNEHSFKLLSDFFKRKVADKQHYVMTSIYDSFDLDNLDHPLPDGRIDQRRMGLKPRVVQEQGCVDADLLLLQILKAKLQQLNELLHGLKQIGAADLLKNYRNLLFSESIELSAEMRRFLRDCYQEILFQLDKLEQSKSNPLIANIPSIAQCEISGLSISKDESRVAYYLTYQLKSQQLYYRKLRRDLFTNINTMEAINDLKTCLVADARLVFCNRPGVTFKTEQQIAQAKQLQDNLFDQKFKAIIESNDIMQLREFLLALAEGNKIDFQKILADLELTFICELFKTNPLDIASIHEFNTDLADYGVEFRLLDICKILSQQDTWINFLHNLLHQYKLPNALLKSLLNIGYDLIQTSQPGIKKRTSQSEFNLKLTQTLRSVNSVYTAAFMPQPISKRTTLGMQIFNIKSMSPQQVRERLQILIDAGCSMNDHLPISNTMAHTFVVYEREDLLYTLLDFNDNLANENKINLNSVNTEQNSAFPDGRSPLHLAVQTFASLAIIDRLLKAGANLNIQDIYGATPLHYAVLLGRVGIIIHLINAGASLDIPDNKGNKPFDYLDERKVITAFNFDLQADENVIKKMGHLTSMKYERRSVGAIQNYLLVSPESHEYFWKEPTTGMAGDMDTKLMFPTMRTHYFDAKLNETPTIKILHDEMKKNECTPSDIAFINKQIADLDDEILFDHICSERKRLQELTLLTKGDVSILVNLLKQEYELHTQIAAQLKQLKEADNKSIQINHNNIFQMTLMRVAGKYQIQIKIINKGEVNIDHLKLYCKYPYLIDPNGQVTFAGMSLSKIFNIWSAMILSCKMNNQLIAVKQMQSTSEETTTHTTQPNLITPLSPPSAPSHEEALSIAAPKQSTKSLQQTIPSPQASQPFSLTGNAADDSLSTFLQTFSQFNITKGSSARMDVGGFELYFHNIKTEDRKLWEELIRYGDKESIENVLRANKTYLLTTVIGDPHNPMVALLKQNECSFGNTILHNRMIQSHDQSVIDLRNADNETTNLLKSGQSGAKYILSYYEQLQTKIKTDSPIIAAKKRCEIDTAISMKDIENKTPLLLALKNINVSYALRLINLDENKLTLECADKKEMRTPLHIACILGLTKVVDKLLSLQVNRSALDCDGHMPFYYLKCSPAEKLQNIRKVLLSINFFAGKYFKESDIDCVCNELLQHNNSLEKELANLVKKYIAQQMAPTSRLH